MLAMMALSGMTTLIAFTGLIIASPSNGLIWGTVFAIVLAGGFMAGGLIMYSVIRAQER